MGQRADKKNGDRFQSLRELLSADEQALRERSPSLELPEPEQFFAEEAFLEALQEPVPIPEGPVFWLRRQLAALGTTLRQSWSRHRLWATFAAAAGALCLLSVSSLPSFLTSPSFAPSVRQGERAGLLADAGGSATGMKGATSFGAREEHVVLHLGRWDARARRVVRLAPGARCHPKESLVFGLSPLAPGGYVYLFLLSPTQPPRLLYPFHPNKPRRWRASRALQLIEHDRAVQQYQLTHERGALVFLALQVPTPLTQTQRALLLQKLQRDDDRKALLRRLPWLPQAMTLHRFPLFVEPKP